MSDADIYHHVAEHGLKRLTGNWATLPVVTSNQSDYGKDLDAGFVHFVVDYRGAPFMGINGRNPAVDVNGFYELNIFTPQNSGIGMGLTYAGEIAAFYRGKSFEGIDCRAPSIVASRQVEYAKGEFWLTPLLIPFRYAIHISIL